MAPSGVYHDRPGRAREIPASVFATSPVALYRNPRELPLDLIQKIISCVEDVADIARLTRTSRLFYYMTLPRLYERVTLRSYPELRYVDGEPEGYGGGSPFSMGLLGLVTKNVAAYVKHWTVTGEWRERDVQEFLKGRIPDNSMMLTISIRAAMDRMSLLESFWWDMNAKPMSTLYQGLTLRSNLTSLRIKSPTQRVIRPTTIVPPIPSLKELWLSDVDPLCYPDDFSFLLLHSKRLEKLNLHWSPRMREQGEPSINLHSLFGKCVAAGYHMPIKKLGLMNMYSPNQGELAQSLDVNMLERVAFINCVDTKNPRTVFFDQTWAKSTDEDIPKKIKMMRGEATDRGQVEIISRIEALEEFYTISRLSPDRTKSTPNGTNSSGVSPADGSSDSSVNTPYTPTENVHLAADYLATLAQHHGTTLRKVLFSDQWQLSEATAVSFVKSCPHLQQFGLAIDASNLTTLRRLLPYAPNVRVLRLLHIGFEEDSWTSDQEQRHLLGLKLEFAKDIYCNLLYVGLGRRGYSLQPVNHTPFIDEETGINEPRWRPMTALSAEQLNEIDLWRMDTMALL